MAGRTNIKDFVYWDPKPTTCPICGGQVSYNKNPKYQSGYCYHCEQCHAQVGTFKKDPDIAMGTLADYETRKKRVEVHKLFDRFWRGEKTRKKNYQKLGEAIGLEPDKCHFGSMNLDELERAEQVLLKWWREKYDK